MLPSPLLSAPGAVPAAGLDESVAAHYGDPYAEQRALSRGEAIVDRGNRDVVRVSGGDRLTWLNALTSQKLDDLPPGRPTEALILDAQGRVEHHLALADDGAAVWAQVEPGTAGPLISYLEKMRFRADVEISDETEAFAVVSAGAQAGASVEADGTATGLPIRIGADLLIPREGLARLADSGRLAGLWAHDALRIAEHRPRLGFDTDDKTIPHEVGWIETAVHLSKGCYRGQETVARVHNVGHPPRRLVMLHLDGSADSLPGHGEAVLLGEKQVGFVGSSARHHELGPIALALIKRTVPVDDQLVAGGVAASQEIIVPPDAGKNVAIDPALRRSRRRTLL